MKISAFNVTALIIILTFPVFSQGLTTEGNIGVGGALSFSSISYEKSNTTTIELSPMVSTFLDDNFEFGSFFSYKSERSSNYTVSDLGIGPFMNYYLTDDPVKPFIGVSYTYGNTTVSVEEANIKSESSPRNTVSFTGGVLISLNESVALAPFIQFSHKWGTEKKETPYSEPVDIEAMNQLLLGITIKAFL